MSERRRVMRLVLGVSSVAVFALLLVFCLTPFAVTSFGLDMRPPWQDKAAWHLSRIDWFVQDPACEPIVLKHRAALLAMQVDAVPTLMERVATGANRHYRERAVVLLHDIGREAHALVSEAAVNADGDRRGRLLYAAFVAFNDREALGDWLEYALHRGPFALQDTFCEHHLHKLWNASMPEYAIADGDALTINPQFVAWWRANGTDVPVAILSD